VQVGAAGLAVVELMPANKIIIARTKPMTKFLIFILDSLIPGYGSSQPFGGRERQLL